MPGLEADCVLLLDTDTRPQRPKPWACWWTGRASSPRPRPSSFGQRIQPAPSAEATLAAEQQARSREELNMLYVAMTRAKHCLALSSVQPGNSAPGSWWNRLAPLVTEVDLQAQAPAAHGAEAAAPADVPETFTIPSLPALPEALQTARVHTAAGLEGDAPWPCRAMRNRPRCRARAMPCTSCWSRPVWPVPRWPMCVPMAGPLRALARLAADHDITPAAAEQAARMAQAILAGEGAWAWDAALIQTAINEAPLHYQGQSLRIDRLVQRRALSRPMTPWRAGGCWTTKRHAAPAPAGPGGAAAALPRGRVCVDAGRGGACRVPHGRWAHGDGGWRRSLPPPWGILPPPALRRWMALRCPQRLPLPALVRPTCTNGARIPGRAPCSDLHCSCHLLDVDPKASRVPSPILRPRHFCRSRNLLRCGHHWRWPRGLMAAEVLAQSGVAAHLFDAMPSVGRKVSAGGQGRAQPHAL